MWKIIYSHGKSGHPWDDPRIEAIKHHAEKLGIEMDSIAYDETDDVPQMIEKAQIICSPPNANPEKLILFGSSRGAFVASAVSRHIFETYSRKLAGLFMMAPAIGIKPHYYPEPFPVPHAKYCEAIHPYSDEVVPFQNAVNFFAEHKHTLHLVEDTHVLHNQVEFISERAKAFLQIITG